MPTPIENSKIVMMKILLEWQIYLSQEITTMQPWKQLVVHSDIS